MSLRLMALISLAAAASSACVVIPVPVRRGHYYDRAPAVIVTPPPVYAPYPRHRDRW